MMERLPAHSFTTGRRVEIQTSEAKQTSAWSLSLTDKDDPSQLISILLPAGKCVKVSLNTLPLLWVTIRISSSSGVEARVSHRLA